LVKNISNFVTPLENSPTCITITVEIVINGHTFWLKLKNLENKLLGGIELGIPTGQGSYTYKVPKFGPNIIYLCLSTNFWHLKSFYVFFSSISQLFSAPLSMIQGCRQGGAREALAPPVFVRSVNPISTRGGTLSPPSTTSPPGFLYLATALYDL
jgi:hypothetical protein